jgi:hypothetical protein
MVTSTHKSLQVAPNSSQKGKGSMDDSSTGSDEIVYKGNPSRRGIGQEMEWRYRGRSGSEVTNNEPISAPTGTNAQQSEGFQRFYKAVVSPSHVRVTAGGRIVPNTRGPSSPLAKRSKDRVTTNDVGQNSQPPQLSTEGVLPARVASMPIFAPHCYPGAGTLPGPFPPFGGPMPMMPMATGLGMPGFPVQQTMPNGVAASENGGKIKKLGENHGGQVLDDKVKISPPEHFDHSKPFFYNGQMMLPVPAFPPQMAAFMPPPGMVAGFAMPFPGAMIPPPMAMNPMLAQMGMSSAQQSSSMSFANISGTKHDIAGPPPNLQAPSAPPVSSIRPSEISKKQLETLRNALKYHEDQLQYNRHQIDEKDMERTIKMLTLQIERFEALRQGQLDYEKKHYPRRDDSKNTADSSSSTRGATPTLSTHAEEHGHAVDQVSTGGAGPAPGLARKQDGYYAKPGINTSQNNQAAYNFDHSEHSGNNNEPIKKSAFPSGAVHARAFVPRGSSALSTCATDIHDQVEDSIIGEGVQDAAERRLLSAGNHIWNNNWPGNWGVQSTEAAPNDAFEHRKQRTASDEVKQFGRPYLVGTLPKGMNPATAKDADYVYERPLTEEEIRSRFLYWGKAPLFTRRGLPKYDGRNFYPASPKESHSRPMSSQKPDSGAPDVDFAFDPPTANKADPFRPATPMTGAEPVGPSLANENTPLVSPGAAKEIKVTV